MPSVITHFKILDETKQRLPNNSTARQLIERHPEFAYWGSIGPDFLFFYPRDWQGPIENFFNFIYEFDDLTKDIFKFFKLISDAKRRTGDYISGGLYTEILNTAHSIQATILSSLAKNVVGKIDFYEFVIPPFATNIAANKINEWWWIDVAHHRLTANYARKLFENCGQNRQLKAYAYGYITHIGADVIGHPFVNTICGGPYRTQWRRHSFIEKAYDTYVWNIKHNESISKSQAYKRIIFNNVNELPNSLADLISKTLNDVYGHLNMVKGVPDRESVKTMYLLFLKWLKASTSRGLLNLPPPENFDWFDLDEEIRKKLEDPMKNRPKIGTPPDVDETDFKKAKRFLSSLLEFCTWIIDTIVKYLTLPQSLLARLSTTALRYLLWLVQKLIYELYDKLKLAMSLGGYTYPEPHHLSQYYQSIITPNVGRYTDFKFPWKHASHSEQTYHMVHPQDFFARDFNYLEDFETKPFGSFGNKEIIGDPLKVFFGSITSDFSEHFRSCDLAKSKLLDFIGRRTLPMPLGSCTDLSLELIKRFENNSTADIPNWNLDGDRGMGWPTWTTNTQTSTVKPDNEWRDYNDFKFDC